MNVYEWDAGGIIQAVVYSLFLIGSVTAVYVFVRAAVEQYKAKEQTKRFLSPMQRISAGVLLAVWLAFLPVYYLSQEFYGGIAVLRPAIVAAHNTLRVFILDGEFTIINTAMEKLPPVLNAVFSFYASVLYVVAPLLTAGFILSLFKGLLDKFRFNNLGRRGKTCIFSELNECSIALAESIYGLDEKDKPAIVFAEVFEKNEEADYELMERAQNLRAICLKQDVTLLVPRKRKKKKESAEIEYFFIGKDESENVSQASKLAEIFTEKTGCGCPKLYVFASNEVSGRLVDAIARRAQKKEEAGGGETKQTEKKNNSFMIRRVDPVMQLAWRTVPKMGLLTRFGADKLISVLIVGMGDYGMAFFKTLLWFCQLDGYRLEINVVEKRRDTDPDNIRDQIRRCCPELLKFNDSQVDGECSYSIRFYTGVDVKGGSFSDLFFYDGFDPQKRETAERLRRTDVALVTLGDDDLNTGTALYLRSLFDRIHNPVVTENRKILDEIPAIYSVVFDEQKCNLLNHGKMWTDTDDTSAWLTDDLNMPYNICFFGKLSEQYAYDMVMDPVGESTGVERHQKWAAAKEPDGEDGELLLQAMVRAGDQLQRSEYFRYSSIAQGLHKLALERIFRDRMRCLKPEQRDEKTLCDCEHCRWRSRTEHMRWNAYMRTIGYQWGPRKDSRSKRHHCLIPWDELSDDYKKLDD